MTDHELLLKAKEILFDVAVRKRSGVTDNGAAFVPFETLLACADMTQAIEAHLKYPPPQKEWVPLTSKEMYALFPINNDILEKRIAEFAIAIEEKLKEKNT